MPVYEFFCPDCMTMFNFYSPSVNTNTIPSCPKCSRKQLTRIMSTFSTISGKHDTQEDDEDLPFDEEKMEKAMRMLESEMSSVDEDDPRQASALVRKMTEAMGGKLDDGMEEALRRMEAGEDPEKIEEEMGDQLDPEKLFKEAKKLKASRKKITYDDTLYDL